jgi:hypothetical protein
MHVTVLPLVFLVVWIGIAVLAMARKKSIIVGFGGGFVAATLTVGLLALATTERKPSSTNRHRQQSSSAVPGLDRGVASFLAAHPEFGKATNGWDAPDWAEGPRRWVRFDGGRELLFYLKGEVVVSVYENVPGQGLTRVWNSP